MGHEDPRRYARHSARCVHVHAPPARGRGRRDRAVELSVPALVVEACARPRRRQYDRPQAGFTDAADGPEVRRAVRGGRDPRRRRQRRDRPWRQSRHGAGARSARRQDRLHRLDRGRQADHAGGSRHVEAPVARARRQVAQHRVRRRRHGSGGEGRAHRDLLQQGRGVRGGLAPLPRGLDPRRVHGQAHRAREGPHRRRSHGQGHAHGPGGLEGADGHRAVLHRGGQAGGRAPGGGRRPRQRRQR